MKKEITFSLITLGCPKSQIEREKYIFTLEGKGFKFKENASDSDLLIINTCGFIESAKKETIDTIFEAVRRKEKGHFQKIIAAGCFTQRYFESLKSEIPELDGIYGLYQYEELTKDIEQILGGKKVYKRYSTGDLKKTNLNTPKKNSLKTYSYILISDGCNKSCTYCAIPQIRGPYRSRNPKSIIEEITNEVKNGVKEIILIGNNVANYNNDIDRKKGIAFLLEKIAKIENLNWVRLLYLHPDNFDDRLIKTIKENKEVVPYFDLPLQHGSNKILKKMGREKCRKEYLKLIDKIKKEVPESILRTTFITGFPGETENDFNELVNFIKDINFDYVGVFSYSKEENTKAFSLEGQIDEAEIKKRQFYLTELIDTLAIEKWKEKLNRDYKVLIEGSEGDYHQGRFYGQAPEIDGVTYVKKDGLKVGKIYNVKMESFENYDLYGVVND